MRQTAAAMNLGGSGRGRNISSSGFTFIVELLLHRPPVRIDLMRFRAVVEDRMLETGPPVAGRAREPARTLPGAAGLVARAGDAIDLVARSAEPPAASVRLRARIRDKEESVDRTDKAALGADPIFDLHTKPPEHIKSKA